MLHFTQTICLALYLCASIRPRCHGRPRAQLSRRFYFCAESATARQLLQAAPSSQSFHDACRAVISALCTAVGRSKVGERREGRTKSTGTNAHNRGLKSDDEGGPALLGCRGCGFRPGSSARVAAGSCALQARTRSRPRVHGAGAKSNARATTG
jgi:hypothetical protein